MTIVAAASAAILAGSSSEGRAAPEHAVAPAAPAASGTLTMAIATDPGNLDPHLTLLGAARTVGSFTYDTLVNVVGPGRLAGNLARTWRVASPKRVEFTLRRGITCSDGSAMTATVIKRNLDFVANPANKSPYLGVGVPVGATTTANNGTGRVVVSTKSPNPFMIHGLGLVQMVCSRGLENRSLLDRGALGSGPYRLVESVSGDHYTFQVRNGYRWGPNGATTAARRLPARVILRVVSNETTAANLLLTGGLNVATIIGAERARLNGRNYFRRTTIAFPTELFFNQRQGRPGADASRAAGDRPGDQPQAVRHGRGLGPRRARHAAHEAGRHAVPRQHRGRHRARVQPRRRTLGAQRQRHAAQDHLSRPTRASRRSTRRWSSCSSSSRPPASASRWPG